MLSLTGVVLPLMVIPVAKAGIEFTLSPLNLNMRIDAKESISRWIFCILLIALAPLFLMMLFEINNSLMDGMRGMALTTGATPDMSNIKTGNVFLTSLIKLGFQILAFYIAVLFEVRKIVITVFFIFTPVAAIMWAINKNVNAFGIWFGELISNVFMQFFYGLIFSIFSYMASTSTLGYVQIFIWQTMILTLAKVLRNSMQGLYTRLSGVDEEGIATGFTKTALRATGLQSAFRAAKSTFGNGSGFKGSSGQSTGNSSESSPLNSNAPGGAPNSINPPGGGGSSTPSTPIYGANGNIISRVSQSTPGMAAPINGGGSPGINSPSSPSGGRSPAGPNINSNASKANQMANSQRMLKMGMGAVNKASNVAGHIAGGMAAAAMIPFGGDAMRVAHGGVGNLVAGGIRAVANPVTAAGIAAAQSIKNKTNFGDNLKTMTNSNTNYGAAVKLGSLAYNNASNNEKGVNDTLGAMDPHSDSHYVRWHYAPASANVDSFRYTDKMLSKE